jgi:hypothetical protein
MRAQKHAHDNASRSSVHRIVLLCLVLLLQHAHFRANDSGGGLLEMLDAAHHRDTSVL